MFCSNCGTQIPDEANFCWQCGKSQKDKTQGQESKWETCEIQIEVVKDIGLLGGIGFGSTEATIRFRVEAIGAKGIYFPYVSKPFKAANYYTPGGEQAKDAINRLVIQLTKDEWEPVETRGENWFNYRFRRRVKP